jgi:SH3 domain-containing protein
MRAGWIRRASSFAGVAALTGFLAACAPWPPAELPPPPVVPPPPPAPPLPPTAVANYVVTVPLHLREWPGVSAQILGTLPPGAPVRTTGSVRGIWWEVQTPEGTGWVSSRYLRP